MGDSVVEIGHNRNGLINDPLVAEIRTWMNTESLVLMLVLLGRMSEFVPTCNVHVDSALAALDEVRHKFLRLSETQGSSSFA